MSSTDADRPLEETALLHEGLAHPARVAVLRELRAARRLTMAELPLRVSKAHREVDTRTLQYHVQKMHVAGIVDLRREGGSDVAVLVRDVSRRVRPA